MIKAINEFAEKFSVNVSTKLELRPSRSSEFKFEDYIKVKEHLQKEGFVLDKRGERSVSNFDITETCVADYIKDNFIVQVWYVKTQTKEERCAELRRQMEELRCGE